jgi:hypothetical protein
MHNTDRKLFKIAQPETFVVDRIAQRIIENKKHFDEIVIRFKEVVNSEEIDCCQTEQQRKDQAQRRCTSGLHAADGLSERAEGIRR